MIELLYDPYKKWSDGGSVYILSDLHFGDKNCQLKTPDWISPEKQLGIINSMVRKSDTFVCLGDVGESRYVKDIKARRKILFLGNHDRKTNNTGLFDEIYAGPLFISEKILLSHEPVHGLPWCLNIHGHDHANAEHYVDGCKHLNVAANVCNYTPVNLGQLIRAGILADIENIHRQVIRNRTAAKRDHHT